MAPRDTENNAYAKFWGDKQRALWYVMVFREWSIGKYTPPRALKWLFFTAGKKEGLRISCAFIQKQSLYITNFQIKVMINR